MKYLSVCSGIEAATVAWHPLGWDPVGFSEIEKFPSAVLAHHYPDTPNLGDMTKYGDWPDDLRPDLIVGGTPCQSFSVAGLRQGLDDPRGNLALVFLGLVDKYRPRWVVWENVPGVRSSGRGRDFGAFLGALGELGYGWAYRSLDAQYFGLAQRRERVFVVGHLGDWRPPVAVLLEPEGLRGDPAPRREAGEVAPTIPARSLGGGGLGADFDCDGGLVTDASAFPTCGTLSDGAHMGGGLNGQDAYTGRILPMIPLAHALRGEGFDASEDGTGRGTPIIPVIDKRTGQAGSDVSPTLKTDLAHDMGPVVAIRTANTGANGHGVAEDVAHTLDQTNGQAVVAFAENQRGELRTSDISPQLTTGGGKPGQGYPAIAFGHQNSASQGASVGSVSPTLDKSKTPAVAIQERAVSEGSSGPGGKGFREELAYTLEARHRPQSVGTPMAVRRLTPTECSRLQGFSDDYLELDKDADAEEARSRAILRRVWVAAHQEANGIKGRLGELVALLSPQVLLAGVSLGWIPWSVARWGAAIGGPLSRQDAWPEAAVRLLREYAETGPSPYRRESIEQCARELGGPLSFLSHEGTLYATDLFAAVVQQSPSAERVLRQARAEVQEVWRSTGRGWQAGKRVADGPRYKALGNSMAVPVMRWIGERIALCDDVISEESNAH